MLFINTMFVVQVVCSIIMFFFVRHVDTRDLDEKWCDKLELSGCDRERYTNIVNTLIFTILAIPYTLVIVVVFIFTLITMPFRGGNSE